MLTEGGLNVAVRYVNMFYGEDRLVKALQRAYPSAPLQSIRALARYGREEARIVRDANRNDSNSPIRPSQRYRNMDIDAKVRYRFRVRYKIGDGPEQSAIVRVDVDDPMGMADLHIELIRTIQAFATRRTGTNYPKFGVPDVIGVPVLVTVERGER